MLCCRVVTEMVLPHPGAEVRKTGVCLLAVCLLCVWWLQAMRLTWRLGAGQTKVRQRKQPDDAIVATLLAQDSYLGGFHRKAASLRRCRSHSTDAINLAHNQPISVANPQGHHRFNGGGLTPLSDELLQLVFRRFQAARLLPMTSVSLNWSVSHCRYISLSSTVGSSLWYTICCPALPPCL